MKIKKIEKKTTYVFNITQSSIKIIFIYMYISVYNCYNNLATDTDR